MVLPLEVSGFLCGLSNRGLDLTIALVMALAVEGLS